MLRLRRKLTAESFKREALGVWDKAGMKRRAVDHAAWDALAIDSPDPDWQLAALGIDMNLERTKVSIAAAAFADEGKIHLELAADTPFADEGTDALVAWVWERAKRRVPVIIDAYSPARDILEVPLKRKKIFVIITGANEMTQGCALLAQAVDRESSISHFGQEHLTDSVKSTIREDIKNRPGSYKWNRETLEDDLSPMMAITGAHFGALKKARRNSAGSGGSKHGFASG